MDGRQFSSWLSLLDIDRPKRCEFGRHGLALWPCSGYTTHCSRTHPRAAKNKRLAIYPLRSANISVNFAVPLARPR